MSKIYEALEYAQQEREGSREFPVVPIPEKSASKISRLEMEDEMISLYHNIDSLLPDSQKKIVQFISSRNGEGSSTMIREFARVTSLKLNTSVLLLDANHQASQTSFFDIKPETGWDEVITDDKPIKEVLYQVGESRLYISQLSIKNGSIISIVGSPRIEGFFKELKQDFDLILVDSPPVSVTNDGIALSHKVDGVVMVVEAENTRWQTALSVKEKIVKRGGNILGVIINKKKYYIPRLIYNRL